MDPQNQLSGLDPKLKEAYERVMGTTIPPASPEPQRGELVSPQGASQTEPVPPPPQQPPIQEQPAPPPVVAPLQSPEPSSPPPTEPSPSPVQPAEPPPKPDTQQPSHIATGFVANATKKEKRGGLKLSPPLLIVIGAVFLLLYIFFWIRVFNLSLF